LEHPMYYSSPYNFDSTVKKTMQPPAKVEINDLTLDEDGEGMVGAYLTRDEKIIIVKMLDEIGIHRIATLGFPAPVSREEVEIAKEISHLGLRAKLESLASTKEDIERALECNVWGVVIRKPVSELYMVPVDHSKKRKIEDFVEVASFAKDKGLHIAHMAQDITRANSEMARDIIMSIHEKVGLDELCLTDSQGVATPFGMKHLVETVREWIDIPLQVHCHNHLGLGVANACAAVSAGAQVVHTTVCGMGHYAGMPALEEVAVALKIGFDIDIGIKYEKLCELAKAVELFTNIRMQPHKAIIGEQAFVKSEEIKDINALINADKGGLHKKWFPFLPEFVGNRSRVLMAEKVTQEAVKYNLSELGIEATDQNIEEILTRVKAITRKQRRVISDEEFKTIIQAVV
jgi:isopropylmalate/homocitrate/citramalate synthase